jgi:hypothetical protein
VAEVGARSPSPLLLIPRATLNYKNADKDVGERWVIARPASLNSPSASLAMATMYANSERRFLGVRTRSLFIRESG